MDFGAAIKALKKGKRVARAGWNGKGMWLQLVQQQTGVLVPGPSGQRVARSWVATRLAYVEMLTAQGQLVPWLASQTDVLAEDWLAVS